MKIKNITQYLESIAPSIYQEGYDNSGLIVGNPNTTVKGIMLCLDSIESVIDEAIQKKCNLVIAHHPIVFKGLKRFNGKNYVERTIIKAIKNDIAIYAIHTNLDNIKAGVNGKIAEKIGLINTSILSPKKVLKKLFAFIPVTHGDILKDALFKVGGGFANNSIKVSYATIGAATHQNTSSPQIKLEIIFPIDKQGQIINTLHQSLEGQHFTYDIMDIHNKHQEIGSGMIGELPKEMEATKFLKSLKKTMGTGCVKYTQPLGNKIKKIAVCGGSGGFLLSSAIAQKADIFITSDYKYHEFFDANDQIIIADIGHYESEQYTIELLYEILSEKFTTFALFKTSVDTNPVNYI